VVYIKLTDVYWYEPTLLTFCTFMSSVWILVVDDVAFVDSLASIPASKWILFISQLDLSGATNRARGSAFFFVMFSEFVVHLYLLDRVRLLDSHN
jgi:hypothetical protein